MSMPVDNVGQMYFTVSVFEERKEMKATVLAIGKCKKNSPEAMIIDEYVKRSGWDVVFKEKDNTSQEEEAKFLQANISPGAKVIVLDERGENMKSLALAAKIESWMLNGCSEVCFLIGGADGPTSIYVSSLLLKSGGYQVEVGTIALAAYTYMALVPLIQPPIMRLLTTKKERLVRMTQLRQVSKTEKIIFPIAVTIIIALLVPSAAPLVGMLMLGNLFKESGVVDRITKTAQNELMNIITIFLGVSVGATTVAEKVISVAFLKVILLGVVAFGVGTASGVLFGKLMCLVTKGKVNPLIGSAGVSAVPMAARQSQKVGAEADPTNFLLMHAMGPNVAGVIGSAVAAGVLLSIIPH